MGAYLSILHFEILSSNKKKNWLVPKDRERSFQNPMLKSSYILTENFLAVAV